ncbi:MAG: HD superfamily phosphohydrolase YqeK [Cyclobacteriaceae bacterium]|jgi:HD superfamily phosphohydrolase YqeK
MALWPPSFINCDKSSLSAGAFKVSDTQCAMKIKNSHELHSVEITSLSQRLIHGRIALKLARKHFGI